MDDPLESERQRIRELLANELATAWRERAYSSEDIQRVLRALQATDPGELEQRLRIAGFTLGAYVNEEAPDIEQNCKTCMYFEPHRRYCALPELRCAVEPEWSCVLWRI